MSGVMVISDVMETMKRTHGGPCIQDIICVKDDRDVDEKGARKGPDGNEK